MNENLSAVSTQPLASVDANSTQPIGSTNNAAPATPHLSRAERRLNARIERKKGMRGAKGSYSKELGVRLNYDRTIKVHQKNNKAWDDCLMLRQATHHILHTCTALLPFMNSKELRPHIVDQGYLSRIALAMVEEVRSLYARMEKNSAKHVNLRGTASTMEETMEAFQVYNEYLSLLEVYDSGAGKLYDMVVEQIQLAVAQYKNAVGDEVAAPVITSLNHAVYNMVQGRRQTKAMAKGEEVAQTALAEATSV